MPNKIIASGLILAPFLFNKKYSQYLVFALVKTGASFFFREKH